MCGSFDIVITVDCHDVMPIRGELIVYVSDQVAAIPTLKNNQFTLSSFDDAEEVDVSVVVASIKEFLDSIGEGAKFAVVSGSGIVRITSVSGGVIEREAPASQNMFSCPHCGFVSRFEVDLANHMKLHYLV